MKKYILYQITSPTGKVYIGQTSNLKLRLRNYKYCKCISQKILFNSIKKHGWINHKFNILYENVNTIEEIDLLEIKYIAFYKNLNISLNIAKGGRNGNKGNIRSRGKNHHGAVQVYQFDTKGNYLKMFDTITEAAKECKISINNISKALKRENAYASGYLWLNKEKYDNNINLVRKNNVFKRCVQLTKNNEYINTFCSDKEASIKTNIYHNNILQCLRGDRKTAGGYIWLNEKEYNLIKK